jgi:predicted nucleotidyltransferase
VQPVAEELVREAARRLGEAARKPARVILFGSYARGEAEATSDLDFLVVQKDGFNRRQEIVRLQDVLSPLRVPAEVLVIDHEEAERPEGAGDAVREALTSGAVLYEST